MRTPIDLIVRHFQSIDPKLAKVIEEINFEEWFESEVLESDQIFKSLCRTIVGQQLAGKAASAIYKRFEDLLQSKVTPQNVLSHSPDEIRAVGLSWAKVRSVIDLSTKIINQELLLSNLANLSNEELITELVTVKGIGRWTAEMFLMFRLGREDIFSWGDLGLKKGLEKYLNQSNLTPAEQLSLVSQWIPYRTYGAIAMWHILDNR